MAPGLLWLFKTPLCAFVGVERAYKDSPACVGNPGDFVLTTQLGLVVLMGVVAAIAFAYEFNHLDDRSIFVRTFGRGSALGEIGRRVRFPVTGGQIAADGGRLDFDIADPSAVSRDRIESEINRLIAEDHPVSEQWISDAELAANPGLVRTMSVMPPTGTGRVRLVSIGEGGSIDLQPCGGTHVRRTGEIGHVAVGKPESKGKQNRRIRLTIA